MRLSSPLHLSYPCTDTEDGSARYPYSTQFPRINRYQRDQRRMSYLFAPSHHGDPL